MCHAGNLRLIGCSIRPSDGLFRCGVLFASLMSLMLAACGPGLVGAREAVNRAQEQGRQMQSTNTPNETTLSYRVHLKAAETAIEKHRYKEAINEASTAEQEAKRVLQKRRQLADDLQLRLAAVRKVLETQARPSSTILEFYFSALDAVQKQEYEKADKILSELETLVLREMPAVIRAKLVIQANEWYYEQKNIVPIHANIAENGEPGAVIFELDHPVQAAFLGSRLVSRDTIFMRVYIEDKKFTGEGWVERRFIQ